MLYRHRLFLSITLGLAIGLASLYMRASSGIISDLTIPHCGARNLMAGVNPYECVTEGMPSNPLTTVLAMIPFAWMPIEVASAVIMGISSGLLAYALNRRNEPWRLVALLSVPFIYSVQVAQWPPLFLAAAYLTWLYPVVLVKPHLGLSVAVMNLKPLRFALTALLFLVTLFVWPGWIGLWWQQSSGYGGFIPVLTVAGLPLLAALWRWRTEPAQWLLLMSITPQRAWYDQLLLWTIPTTARQAVALTAASWIMWLPHLIWGAQALGEYIYPWLIVSLYYPSLIMVLLNRKDRRDRTASRAPS